MATLRKELNRKLGTSGSREYPKDAYISSMSWTRLFSHFAPFAVFLLFISIISGGREWFNDGWKFLGIAAILLALSLSVIPWIRDFLKR